MSLGEDATPPSQIQKPAEGPSLRPSLALNIDPATVHLLTHITPPQASRTGTNPILFQLQTSPTHPQHIVLTSSPRRLHHTCTCSSSRPLPVTHPVKPRLCTSSSQGLFSPVPLPVQPTHLLYHPQPLEPIPSQIKDKPCTSSSQRNLPLSIIQSRNSPSVARPGQEPRVCS